MRPPRGTHVGCRCGDLWMTYSVDDKRIGQVTGQLADTPTRGLPTRGLDKSQTRQLADWQMPPKERKPRTQSRRWHPRVVQSAICPVRELTSPRVVQSASWRIRELSSNHRPHVWQFAYMTLEKQRLTVANTDIRYDTIRYDGLAYINVRPKADEQPA